MKLLKDEIITKEADGVKITLNPVTTSQQAALLDMIIGGRIGAKGQTDFSCYGLKKMIKTLEIDGVDYNPIDVGTRADLDDSATIRTLVIIGRLLDEACFVSIEQKKSSETSAKQSRPGSNAENAQDRMAADSPAMDAVNQKLSSG